MARGDLTPQEIKLRKTISNNINFLLKSKKSSNILNYFFANKKTLQTLGSQGLIIS